MKQLVIILILALSQAACGVSTVLNAFNSGELSPLLEGRTDVKKYYSGARTVENMLVMSHGGLTKRPGTYYVASAKTSSAVCRLIPFEYSTTQAYVIEVGDEYMRFYMDGGQIIQDDDSVYELTTGYDISDVFEIQFVQSADTMYLVHPEYVPQVLTRTDHNDWSIADFAYENGPFLTENTTEASTIKPSAVTGSITLTGNAAQFNANHVGALWQISHIVDSNRISGNFTADGNSATLAVLKDQEYTCTTHGAWYGRATIQRSYDDGTTWLEVWAQSVRNDGQLSWSETETVDDAIYRLNFYKDAGSNCFYDLASISCIADGYVEITAYTDVNTVTATVVQTLGSTDATWRWAEGAWSPDEGYPSTVAFFNERLVFGGTANKPDTVWFSQTDDWPNFKAGGDDADAFSYTLASDQVNVIHWLVAQNSLLIGTTGAEWKLGPETANQVLSPSNRSCQRQSTYGSANLQAVVVNNTILYIQRQGRKVRQLKYSFELDNWIAPDLTLLSEHITDSGIVDMAFQNTPNPILWCVRDDGVLVGMTLEDNQDVIGWHRHVIDGDVESVAVIPGGAEDEVWLSVKRTIGSSDYRYIEQMQPCDWGSDQEDAFFVDSGLTFDGGASVTITNISKADPGIVYATSHGFSDGSQVRLAGVAGMTEVNNRVFTVGTVSTNYFELRNVVDDANWVTTGYTNYSSGGTATVVENTFTTLTHLERETVAITADGGYHGTDTVVSGTVTLDDYFNTVHIGLPYTAKVKPMKLAYPGAGELAVLVKRITRVSARLYDTLDCSVGTSWTIYDDMSFLETPVTLEVATPLYTGQRQIDFSGDYETAGDIYIQSTKPLPFTLLMLAAEFETER